MADIFVIEDEPAMLENTIELLELLGHSARGAPTVKRALIELEQQTPDIILCDIRLPEISGLELLREVRQHPRLNQVAFILTSASISPEHYITGTHLNASFLVKPYSYTQLEEIIQQALTT